MTFKTSTKQRRTHPASEEFEDVMLSVILLAQTTGNEATLIVSSIGLTISQARTQMAQACTPRVRIRAYGNMERQQPHIIKEILFIVLFLGITKVSFSSAAMRCSVVLVCWRSDRVTDLARLIVKAKSRYDVAAAEGKQYRILADGC